MSESLLTEVFPPESEATMNYDGESTFVNAKPPVTGLSPSLKIEGRSGTAYEVKFLVSEDQAKVLERLAPLFMTLDCFGNEQQSGGYQTTSLYTDTSEYDVFARTQGYRRHKFRVRRYGNGPEVFLERKMRRGDRVAKLRTSMPVHNLQRLSLSDVSESDSPEVWFHQSLIKKKLSPVCEISYTRTAFMGAAEGEGIRLTLDRNIEGRLISDWTFTSHTDSRPLLRDSVILELKFRRTMPTVFRKLVRDLKLEPTGVSKYRHCLLAWGIQTPTSGEESDDA